MFVHSFLSSVSSNSFRNFERLEQSLDRRKTLAKRVSDDGNFSLFDAEFFLEDHFLQKLGGQFFFQKGEVLEEL